MKKLFCVKIQETDKIIPVIDIGEAVRAAAYINSQFLDLHNALRDDKIPLTFAVPAEWDGSAEEHQKALVDGADWRDVI